VIWIGTGKGVCSFDGQKWTYYKKTGGKTLVNNYVRSVMVDNRNHKWFGTEYGVSEFYNGIWTTYLSPKALANYIFTVFQGFKNNIWFGTMAGALRIDESGNQIALTTENGLIYDQIESIAVDNNGSIWFGTQFGVSKYDGSSIKNYNTTNGLAANWTTAILKADNGDIWFASVNKGLSVLHITQ